ncbi:high-affinity choline transporter 1-like [Amblyomma americanum]
MAVYLPAVAAVSLYISLVVCVGVWYGRKFHIGANPFRRPAAVEDSKRRGAPQTRFLQRVFGANRSLSLAVGVCSMTATWVGGGYLSGTAEAVYTHGALYSHAPISYAISLILGGSFFAQKMRETNALTMLDPFQEHYGRWMGLLLCLPAVCGEILWTAAMLAALAQAMSY